MLWSRGPIKVDRKRERVKILDKVFPCEVREYGVRVYAEGAFSLTERLTPLDIPEGLTVFGGRRIEGPSGTGCYVRLSVDRRGLSFSINPVSDKMAELLTVEEIRSLIELGFKEMGRPLRLHTVAEGFGNRDVIAGGFRIPPGDTIGRHTSLVRMAVSRAVTLVWAAEQGARRRAEDVIVLAKAFDGAVLANTMKLVGVLRWIVGALGPPEVAYFLLLYENPLVARYVRKEMAPEMRNHVTRLTALGLMVPGGQESELTTLGRSVGKIVASWVRDLEKGSMRPAIPSSQEAQLLRHFAYYVLLSVLRSFTSVALQRSSRIRGRKKRMKQLLEGKIGGMSFAKLAIIMARRLGNPVPGYILDQELRDLIRDGFVSENLRLRSYGEWVASIALNRTVQLLDIRPSRKVRRLPPEVRFVWMRSRPDVFDAWMWDMRPVLFTKPPESDSRDVQVFAVDWDRVLRRESG
ncbi:MAG: hypothetical protein QXO17_07520 [Nitrososphaerota archaeon]